MKTKSFGYNKVMELIIKKDLDKIIKASKFTCHDSQGIDLYSDVIIYDGSKIFGTNRIAIYSSVLSELKSNENITISSNELLKLSENSSIYFDAKKCHILFNENKISQHFDNYGIGSIDQSYRLIQADKIICLDEYVNETKINLKDILEELNLTDKVLFPSTRIIFCDNGIYLFHTSDCKGYVKLYNDFFKDPICFEARFIKLAVNNIVNASILTKNRKKVAPVYKSDKKGVHHTQDVETICFKNKKELCIIASIGITDKMREQLK